MKVDIELKEGVHAMADGEEKDMDAMAPPSNAQVPSVEGEADWKGRPIEFYKEPGRTGLRQWPDRLPSGYAKKGLFGVRNVYMEADDPLVAHSSPAGGRSYEMWWFTAWFFLPLCIVSVPAATTDGFGDAAEDHSDRVSMLTAVVIDPKLLRPVGVSLFLYYLLFAHALFIGNLVKYAIYFYRYHYYPNKYIKNAGKTWKDWEFGNELDLEIRKEYRKTAIFENTPILLEVFGRMYGNYLEHAMVVIPGFIFHALVVNPRSAAMIMWFWYFTRYFYFVGLYVGPPLLQLFSFSTYGVQALLYLGVLQVFVNEGNPIVPLPRLDFYAY